MHRKNFLQASSILLGGSFFPRLAIAQNSSNETIVPPCLKIGDVVAITSPSGYISLEEILPAVKVLKSWGLAIKIGETIGKRDGTFGGSDTLRATDFQTLLQDKNVNAILCARGGYGAIRIIDKIDFSGLKKNPKWIIGFSDATVFHCHIASCFEVATLHSKMCNSFPNNWQEATEIQKESILSIKNALMHPQKMRYEAPYNKHNKLGIATGKLVGGNLRTIENLSGTVSAIETKDKILFIEETHEYLYNIDRMLWNLERSNKLTNIRGLIIGGIKVKPQTNPDDELNISLQNLILNKVKQYSFPVCFNFPVGHQVDNFALKHNVVHHLKVSLKGTTLVEA